MDKLQIDYDHFSFIGRESKITGTIEINGTCHLYCQIQGNILIGSNADLFIEEGAKIEGNIQGHDIDIYGEVRGNIHSTGKVSFYSTAVFSGELETKELSISPGAKLEMKAQTKKTL